MGYSKALRRRMLITASREYTRRQLEVAKERLSPAEFKSLLEEVGERTGHQQTGGVR